MDATSQKMNLGLMMDTSIELCELTYELIEKENSLDSQETLDWLDKLNEISTRH